MSRGKKPVVLVFAGNIGEFKRFVADQPRAERKLFRYVSGSDVVAGLSAKNFRYHVLPLWWSNGNHKQWLGFVQARDNYKIPKWEGANH